MTKSVLRNASFDALCVLLLVVIGTRNHDTDTGVTGVLFVAAPFLIALALSYGSQLLVPTKNVLANQYVTWISTVAIGLTLRNLVFDRGTALAFVIVATLFLGITMNGWRLALKMRK